MPQDLPFPQWGWTVLLFSLPAVMSHIKHSWQMLLKARACCAACVCRALLQLQRPLLLLPCSQVLLACHSLLLPCLQCKSAQCQQHHIRCVNACCRFATQGTLQHSLLCPFASSSLQLVSNTWHRAADLERVCGPDCILSTNTSTIDIELIGAKTKSQDRIIGAHFFSPAHIMPLLEIVRTNKTSKQVWPCAT